MRQTGRLNWDAIEQQRNDSKHGNGGIKQFIDIYSELCIKQCKDGCKQKKIHTIANCKQGKNRYE